VRSLLVASMASCAMLWSTSTIAAPSFLEISVRFVRVSDGREVGRAVVPPTGYTQLNVPADRRFVIAATAGDNRGIRSIAMSGDLSWACAAPASGLGTRRQGQLGGPSDEQRNNTSAAGAPLLRNVTYTIDPYENRPPRRDCGCAEATTSPLNHRIMLTATNADGVTVQSPLITIGYAAQAPTCAVSGGVCGNKVTGQTLSCPNNGPCDNRRTTSCSGWWIFRRCETLVSTDMFCP
jgi:hypothetical protein